MDVLIKGMGIFKPTLIYIYRVKILGQTVVTLHSIKLYSLKNKYLIKS